MDPRFTDLWVAIGESNRQLGNLEAAREAFQRALALDPGRTDALTAVEAIDASLSAEVTATP
jgi:cytochrome c-type biogenesis protein CcmH/NrfG